MIKRSIQTKTWIFILLVISSQILCANIEISGEACNSDEDCDVPYFICGSDKKCEHKKIFPMTGREIYSLFILLGILIMGTVAGVGGGSTIVPLGILLFYFTVKQSVALANFLIFCNGLVKTFYGLRKKHPNLKFKTIIDYNTVLVFNFSIIGSIFGVIIASLLPSLIQLILLSFILIFSMYKGIRKTYSLCKKEREEKRKKKNGKNNAVGPEEESPENQSISGSGQHEDNKESEKNGDDKKKDKDEEENGDHKNDKLPNIYQKTKEKKLEEEKEVKKENIEYLDSEK